MTQAKGQAKTYGVPSKPRKKRSRKQKNKKKMSKSSISKPMLRGECQEVCKYIDPFCPKAVGTKINDQNARPTSAFTAKLVYSVTTDANGHAAFQFSGRMNSMIVPASTISALGVISAWGIGVKPASSLSVESSYTAYRVVSGGCRVFCNANVTESKGTVQMATALDTPSTSVLHNINDVDWVESVRFPLASVDATFITKPEGPESRKFISFSTYPERTKGMITFVGCTPNTPVASVECIVHYELQAKGGDFTTHLTSPATPMTPKRAVASQATIAEVPSALANGVKARSESMLQVAEKYVMDTVSSYAEEGLAMLLAL